jgi:16S rRNA (adenine1518-N6/adenine1519-N6)-dimethyltransferase
MRKADLLKILAELDFHPGKALGQNFLVDGNLLDFIVRTGAPGPGEIILEAGPGFGVLTRGLLDAGAEVYAIEYDHRLAAYLRRSIENDRFHLTEGDACKVDIQAMLPPDRPFRSIANLPYAISSIFIGRLLELPRPPVQMLFMLQKEMGERLAAPVGSKDYSSLSVRAQALYDTRILRKVPKQVFHPQPEVDSALVLFELRDRIPPAELRTELCRMTRCAFEQRRKMIYKPLSALYPRDILDAALEKAGIPLETRPDNVPVASYLKLAELLLCP